MINTVRTMPEKAAAAVIALILLSFSHPAKAVAEHIPASRGTTLSGADISLPQSLAGRPAVLVLGFSHASQGQVGDWGKQLSRDYGESGKVAFYEMPMLGGAPRILRGMIIRSMGKSVPGKQKAHFLPITDNDSPWKAVAKYNKNRPDDAYVLLTDGNGTVVWRTEGDESDTTYTELRRHLAEVVQQDAH